MAQQMFLRKIPENMQPWECSVNGVKYVYPAGTEQHVPEKVAHLIDAWYAAQEQESAPSGGGGGSAMVVGVNTETGALSHTYEEIITALKELRDVRMQFVEEYDGAVIVHYYSCGGTGENCVFFYNFTHGNNGQVAYLTTVTVYIDNSVRRQEGVVEFMNGTNDA